MMVGRGVQHHKLRHLEGLSLRKLTLSTSPKRPRRETIDDDSLPNALASPSKLSSQVAGLKLEHSRSAIDLKQQNEDEGTNGTSGHADGRTQTTPFKGGMRRRSTLSWSNESPVARQKRLEEAVVERRIDTFFSLHEEDSSKPFYVSETIENTMNPDFQFFNGTPEQDLGRQESFTVKVWARSKSSTIGGWTFLLELEVHMESLHRIGKSLEDCHLPMADNSVIFHLADGVYTDPFNLPNHDVPEGGPSLSRSGTAQPSKTSSYDALMQMKNLTDCIQDALQTRDVLAEQIEAIINENKESEGKISAAAAKRASAGNVQDAVAQMQREVKKVKNSLNQSKTSIQARRDAVNAGRFALKKSETELTLEREQLFRTQAEQEAMKPRTNGQVRRVAQQLLDIFPIEPIDGHALCFTISNLYLPNASSFSSSLSPSPSSAKTLHADEDTTAAALGYSAFIIDTLALKLFIPLPYAITFRGSTSTIFDPLTSQDQLGTNAKLPPNTTPTEENSPWRVFTLSQRGNNDTRFAWALYLLNKCIEEAMSKCELKVIDPRNTLPNLNYLLNVLASGKGEMPARKMGILRGLKGSQTAPVGGMANRGTSIA